MTRRSSVPRPLARQKSDEGERRHPMIPRVRSQGQASALLLLHCVNGGRKCPTGGRARSTARAFWDLRHVIRLTSQARESSTSWLLRDAKLPLTRFQKRLRLFQGSPGAGEIREVDARREQLSSIEHGRKDLGTTVPTKRSEGTE